MVKGEGLGGRLVKRIIMVKEQRLIPKGRGCATFPSSTGLTIIHAAEGTFAQGATGIQINIPAIYPIALPLSYQAWGALFKIAKAQVIHA